MCNAIVEDGINEMISRSFFRVGFIEKRMYIIIFHHDTVPCRKLYFFFQHIHYTGWNKKVMLGIFWRLCDLAGRAADIVDARKVDWLSRVPLKYIK